MINNRTIVLEQTAAEAILVYYTRFFSLEKRVY